MCNKKKLFVVSDIHSFYTIFKNALDISGFDPLNESHWLIVLGDVFDRGEESVKILNYLMSLERKILIRGNHETLLEECLLRGYPEAYDFANKTAKTIWQLGNNSLGDVYTPAYQRVKKYLDSLVNYFETENYIFVHSWIPFVTHNEKFSYYDNWRDAPQDLWDKATWANPFEMYGCTLNKTNKTIVSGHWHCSTGHEMFENNYQLWEPFYGEGFIGIDRCTAKTKECNVLVLEDYFMEI